MRFKTTHQFEKDYRRIEKSGKSIDKLHTVMQKLISSERLSYQYKDHALSGQFKYRRECHIEPDWLLVYQVNKKEEVIIFERTGRSISTYGAKPWGRRCRLSIPLKPGKNCSLRLPV